MLLFFSIFWIIFQIVWSCNLCKKKQELLVKTGQWYHGGMAKPVQLDVTEAQLAPSNTPAAHGSTTLPSTNTAHFGQIPSSVSGSVPSSVRPPAGSSRNVPTSDVNLRPLGTAVPSSAYAQQALQSGQVQSRLAQGSQPPHAPAHPADVTRRSNHIDSSHHDDR